MPDFYEEPPPSSFPFFNLARKWGLPYAAVICAVDGSWTLSPGFWGEWGYQQIWERLGDRWGDFRAEFSLVIARERDRQKLYRPRRVMPQTKEKLHAQA